MNIDDEGLRALEVWALARTDAGRKVQEVIKDLRYMVERCNRARMLLASTEAQFLHALARIAALESGGAQ